MSRDESYTDYLRAEWDLFLQNPARTAESLAMVGDSKLQHVLDVGCGAGQEMLPFVKGGSAIGVGIDVSPLAGGVARTLYGDNAPLARVGFSCGVAEQLPFLSDTFDLVICRLALPYTDNAKALAEMSRVLRPGGLLLLKIHSARYYLRKLRTAVGSANLKSMVHSIRVLVSGLIYHATGRQTRSFLTAQGETFQSQWLLRRELRAGGLTIFGELADSSKSAPSLLIRKDSPITRNETR